MAGAGICSCEPAKTNQDGARFLWALDGVGFGELYFYVQDGKIYCDNETMDKEFIKKMLCKMVDDCILTDK